MSDHLYPDAGARDVLRAATQVPRRGHFDAETTTARVLATRALLDAAVALFTAYGLRAESLEDRRQRDPSMMTRWCFDGEVSGHALVLRVKPSGTLYAYRLSYETAMDSAFGCSLTWDVPEKYWMGELLGERDLRTPGYPQLRESALETLARAIVTELRAWETG